MNKHIPILVVGAGPTGLMMACELARHKINFLIIDKTLKINPVANASWIQSRSLEIFDLIGVAEQFVAVGNLCYAIIFYIRSKQVAKLSLEKLSSYYSFIMILHKCKTEQILNSRLQELHHSVERPNYMRNTKHNILFFTGLNIKQTTLKKIIDFIPMQRFFQKYFKN